MKVCSCRVSLMFFIYVRLWFGFAIISVSWSTYGLLFPWINICVVVLHMVLCPSIKLIGVIILFSKSVLTI